MNDAVEFFPDRAYNLIDSSAAERMPRRSRAIVPGESVPTVCSGCPAECAFYAHVDADGRVFATFPVEGHPCRAERLCGRGKRRLGLPFSDDDRVVRPLRRTSTGTFEPIGWDQAYREIAARLRAVIDAHGPQALACTTGLSSYFSVYARRLLHALGSPNLYGVDAACQASRITAWEQTVGHSPQTDVAHARMVVYMGRSPIGSSSAGDADLVERAARRGARIVSVDPRRSSTGSLAADWVMVRPGCDLAFLLGVAHVLIRDGLYDAAFVERHTTGFEEFAEAMRAYTPQWVSQVADVPAAQVEEIARALGAARPRAAVDPGLHGGIGAAYANSTQTARMIALVDALLGCYGQAGGLLNPQVEPELGDLDPQRFPAPPVPAARKLGAERHPLVDEQEGLCTTIGESIELGELRALIAYASNPAMGYGNARDWTRLLGSLDLLVTIDVRMSETALLSDYVLPDVTFLECDRGVGVRDGALFYRNRVIEPRNPQARPADRIFRGLAGALGVGRYLDFTVGDLARAQVAPFGVDLAELRARGFAETGEAPASRTGEPVIATPDGRIAFTSDLWERAGLGRVPVWQPPLVKVPMVETPSAGAVPVEEAPAEGSLGAPVRGAGDAGDGTARTARPDDPATAADAMIGAPAAGAPAAAATAPAATAPVRDSGFFRLISGNSPFESHTSTGMLTGGTGDPALARLASVWMNASRAAALGIADGDLVEVSSDLGRDRAVARLTHDLHPEALFTTASPGGRRGSAAGAEAAGEGAYGVGPLDHTPYRVDPVTGAALTQENRVHVRRADGAL